MSAWNDIKKDFSQIKDEWLSLDPAIRLLDILSLLGVIIFGLTFITVSVLEITVTLTNMAFMIYPIIISGYIFVLRVKLNDPDADKYAARKEFFSLVLLTTFLVVLGFFYAFILDS